MKARIGLLMSVALLFLLSNNPDARGESAAAPADDGSRAVSVRPDSVSADSALYADSQYFSIKRKSTINQPQDNKEVISLSPPEIIFYLNSHFERVDDPAGDYSSFRTQMARVIVAGDVSPVISYNLQGELTRTPELLDAAIEFRPWKNHSLVFGQFKVPFSTTVLVPDRAIPMPNQDLIYTIQPARDQGIYLNSRLRSGLLNLYGGIVNGAGQNIGYSTDYKNYFFRGALNPLSGVEFAANYYRDKSKRNMDSNPLNRHRLGGSISILRSGFRLSGEYILNASEMRRERGYYLLVGYGIKTDNRLFKGVEPLIRRDSYTDFQSRTSLGLNLYLNDSANKIQFYYQINEGRNRIPPHRTFIMAAQICAQRIL